MRSRRAKPLAAAAVLLAASVLLGGCFTIRSASLSQQDVIGPVQIRTELCLRSSAHPVEPAPGLACRSGAPDATTPESTDDDLQLFYAYLIDEDATAPESFTGNGALTGVTFTQHPDFAARLAERPGQTPRFAMKWVAYGSTRIPKLQNVTSPQEAILAPAFQPAAGATGFNARVVHGWRYVSDAAGWELTRPVVCGDTYEGGSRKPATDCGDDTSAGPTGSNYFPRMNGGDPANQFTYPLMTIPVASAAISAPFAGAAIDAGQATSLRFGVTSRAAPGAPPEIPVGASTTIPGGSVRLDRASLPLGPGVDAITAEVSAPASTPTGTYQLTVQLGTGSGARSATAFVGVTATTTTQTPKFDNTGLLTAKQTAAMLRPLLRKTSALRALRKTGKATIRYPSQPGVKLRLVLRRSGKKGKIVAQGTSSPTTGGRDRVILRRSKYGRSQLRAGRTWKGRMVITLTGGQADLVNESISLKFPRR